MGLFRSSEFSSGTRLMFQQSSAPTGWTKDVTHNDKSLRVVNGAVGSGGSVAFSTFAAQSIGNTTLSEAQIPNHLHGVYIATGSAGGTKTFIGDLTTVSATGSSTGTGGGGSHTHSLNMALQYVDTIIGVKN